MNFYTLASQQIKKPLTKFNVISLDIPVVRLQIRKKPVDYHVMFKEKKCLEVLRDYCKHEYLVTSINFNDIEYYCSLMSFKDKGILLVENAFCDMSEMSTIIESKTYDFEDSHLATCHLKLGYGPEGNRSLTIL